ncbi:MAG: hypothetical protein FWE45_02330 [Firmicutes bacterium]|nr:hypothetical protein [Bacillota bacterium]
MENHKSGSDEEAIMGVIADNVAVESSNDDGAVIARAMVSEQRSQSFYPDPRPEVSDEVAEARVRNQKNFGGIKKSLVPVAAFYLFAMIVAGSTLGIVNSPTVMAGTRIYENDSVSVVNAVLWSFIGVLTFLFVLAIVYIVAIKKRDSYEMKESVE